jgi:hypothetical protein
MTQALYAHMNNKRKKNDCASQVITGQMPVSRSHLPHSNQATRGFSFLAGQCLKSGFCPGCKFYSDIDPLYGFKLVFK